MKSTLSRGEANYPFNGTIHHFNCDASGRPCDGFATELLENLLNNDGRFAANEITETPYLDVNLFKSGGVKILRAWLGNLSVQDKIWVKDQADIIYVSSHGYDSLMELFF